MEDGCCTHCPGYFDNVATMTDLENLRSQLEDQIRELSDRLDQVEVS